MKNSYMIPDMFRICPQTGEVLEEQARLRTLTDWPDEAPDFVSPRNAYLSFQVIVRLGSADLSEIRIEADVIAGQHDRIASEEFVYYTQWYHKVKERYYPDALVPLGDEAQSLAAVSRRNAVPSQAFAAVWVDLFVPANIRAGDYQGAIRVHTGAGAETHPIRLQVLETAVPNESLVIADLNSYADNISRRIDSLRDNESRYEDGTFFKFERGFFKMAHEHRCLFHYLPYQHSGELPDTFAPVLEGEGKELRVKDWSRFDEHFGAYLDGSAFADTKRGAIPLPYMYLPFNFHWPADYAKFGTKGYRTEFRAILEEFHRHFTERGWLGTKFELFLNHKKRYKLFPYDGDETRFGWDEKINDIFYDLAKDVLERESGARFVFRTDSSWSYGLHYSKYADIIKLWVVNQQIFSWFPEAIPVLREAGNEVWTYGSAEKISESLLATVISPLIAVARGIDGFDYWENTLWGDNWHETPASEGSAAVFYPGDKLFGIQGPIPSIRLKTLRGAMQVADCMENWIRERPEERRKFMGETVAHALSLEPEAWWPGKPDFLDKPPSEWAGAKLSEAPKAPLYTGQAPESYQILRQTVWGMLG